MCNIYVDFVTGPQEVCNLALTSQIFLQLAAGKPCPRRREPTFMRFSNQSQDYQDSELNLHTWLVRRPNATQFVFAENDALQSEGILEGALLIVDHSISPRDGDIVIAAVHGEFLLRILRKTGGGFALCTTSPRYPDVEMTEEDEVWGVVTAAVNRFG